MHWSFRFIRNCILLTSFFLPFRCPYSWHPFSTVRIRSHDRTSCDRSQRSVRFAQICRLRHTLQVEEITRIELTGNWSSAFTSKAVTTSATSVLMQKNGPSSSSSIKPSISESYSSSSSSRRTAERLQISWTPRECLLAANARALYSSAGVRRCPFEKTAAGKKATVSFRSQRWNSNCFMEH